MVLRRGVTAIMLCVTQGWNKTHDEWVPASDLSKYDPSRVVSKPTAAPPANPSESAKAANVANLHHPGAGLPEAGVDPPVSTSNGHQQPAPVQSKSRPSDKRPKKRPRTAPEVPTNGHLDSEEAMQVH